MPSLAYCETSPASTLLPPAPGGVGPGAGRPGVPGVGSASARSPPQHAHAPAAASAAATVTNFRRFISDMIVRLRCLVPFYYNRGALLGIPKDLTRAAAE